MERAPTRSVVCGFDQLVTCTVSCDTEGPKSSCSTHCPKHQEMKSWMDLQHVRFFYIYTYLFDCSASQLQHVGSSIFFKNLQHGGFLVAACEIQFPDQGSNPDPLHWEHRILATGPPGKSHNRSQICCRHLGSDSTVGQWATGLGDLTTSGRGKHSCPCMVLLPLRAVSPPFQLRNHSLQHFLPLQHKILPGLIHTKPQELAIIDLSPHI